MIIREKQNFVKCQNDRAKEQQRFKPNYHEVIGQKQQNIALNEVMKMAKKINGFTVHYAVKKQDGNIVPLDSLTPEEKADLETNIKQRLSNWGNRYFAQHPEIYDTL